MPSDKTEVVLDDILRNVELAERFARDLTLEQFKIDMQVLYATTRALEIISEASRRLPADLKDRHPDAPWREIADAGNVYRHGYDALVSELLWQTVQTGLAVLRKVVQSELTRKSED